MPKIQETLKSFLILVFSGGSNEENYSKLTVYFHFNNPRGMLS